ARTGYAVPVYVTLPVLAMCSTLACVAVTYLTAPPELRVLAHFYRTTQPAGAWGPVAAYVHRETPAFRNEPFGPDLLALLVALPWLGAMYVGPSYLVARQYTAAAVCGAIVAVGSVYLATAWRRRLPSPEETTAGLLDSASADGTSADFDGDRKKLSSIL